MCCFPDFLTPPNSCWPFVVSAYPTQANLRKRTEKVIHAEKQMADKNQWAIHPKDTWVCEEWICILLASMHDI